MLFERRRKPRSLVSIAPMIDCVFLLLIFFLLTSSFIEQAGLEIELPESVHAAPIRRDIIGVSLSEDGRIEISGKPTQLDDLTARLIERRVQLETDRAVLRADKDVRLELLTAVIDKAKSAGIHDIRIQTVPADR